MNFDLTSRGWLIKRMPIFQVPEMDRLLDQSKVLAAHDYKHMVEVMYRASVTNHDRTGILRHNNPPPNLNNWTGDESCARYMPSWIPTYDVSTSIDCQWWWGGGWRVGAGAGGPWVLPTYSPLAPPSDLLEAMDDAYYFILAALKYLSMLLLLVLRNQ